MDSKEHKVYQTLFGDKKGNCNAACIATILGLQIEDVPNFCCEDDWPINEKKCSQAERTRPSE